MLFEKKNILFEGNFHFSLVLPIIRAENSAKSRLIGLPNHYKTRFPCAVLAVGESEIVSSMALVLKETDKAPIWETAVRQS